MPDALPDPLSTTDEFIQHDGCSTPAGDCTADGSRKSFSQEIPSSLTLPEIPGYEILEILGRGGMGVVFKAKQLGLGRLVAIKMIISGKYADHRELARFRTEGEAIARLRHQNIIQIYDVGEHEGRPYFSLELAESGSLASRLNNTPQVAQEAARIVETLAHAVHAAHEAGIVHRDLKPGNVLLMTDDCLKITDFGLAKCLDDISGPTATDAVMGTPSYMAPEQASGSSKHVGPAADVYALGAILYELLTGRPPFKGATPVDTILQVLSSDPVPPRQLQPKSPRDLETICLKCLEKDISRRYASARNLAEDLHRYRVGEPIRARPVSAGERALKWAWRRPVVAGLLSIIVVIVTASLAGLTGLWLRSESIGREERAQRRLKEAQLVRMYVDTGVRLMDEGDLDGSLSWFVKALVDEPGGPREIARHQRRLAAVWQHCPRPVLFWVHGTEVGSTEFSPDGRLVLIAGKGRTAQVWDAETGRPISQPLEHGDAIKHGCFSHNSRCVATASDDGSTRIWDTASGRPLTPPMMHPGAVWLVTFSPNGRRIVTCCADGGARVWDVETGNLMMPPLAHEHGKTIECVDFSPDGQRIVTASWDQTARVWDANTGRPVTGPLKHAGRVHLALFSPDGRRVVTASMDGTARIWDAETGENTCPLLRHSHAESIYRAAFSPDGRFVVTTGQDRTARIWDSTSGQSMAPPMIHTGEVHAVAYSRDGRQIVTACEDGMARVWNASNGQLLALPLKHNAKVNSAAFSPDGRRVITGSVDRTARVWDLATGKALICDLALSGHLWNAAFSADMQRVVAASGDSVRVADTVSGKSLHPLLPHNGSSVRATLSPNGRQVVTAGLDGTAQVWDVETGRQASPPFRNTAGMYYAAFSSNGQRIVTCNKDGTAQVWDVKNGLKVSPLLHHEKNHEDTSVLHAEFSPNDRWVVTAARDGTARVWDVENGHLVCSPLRHTRAVRHATFSPDGRRVVTAAFDSTARIWNAETGEPVTLALRHTAEVQYAAFSPDGRRVVTASLDKTARVWDAETGEPLCPPLKHNDYVVHAVFSADGQRVLTSSWDNTARVWDVESGQPLCPPLRHPGKVQRAAFSLDGRQVLTVSHDLKVWKWDLPDYERPPSDWRLLAELLSGQEMDSQGGMNALSAEALGADWEILRKKYPDDFAIPLAGKDK